MKDIFTATKEYLKVAGRTKGSDYGPGTSVCLGQAIFQVVGAPYGYGTFYDIAPSFRAASDIIADLAGLGRGAGALPAFNDKATDDEGGAILDKAAQHQRHRCNQTPGGRMAYIIGGVTVPLLNLR